MIIYGSPMSPFTARVRFSLYFKDLPFEQVKPSSMGGMKSDAFLAVAPIGKIPVLERPDGWRLAESETIAEYLEDTVPTPALRPESPELRAQARLIARVCELYVLHPLLYGLGHMMPISLHRQPAPLDAATLEREGVVLNRGLDNLERLLAPGGPFALGARPSTADGALVPYLVFVAYAETLFARTDFLSNRARLGPYLKEVSAALPVADRSRREVEQALADRRGEVAANAKTQAAPVA